MNRKVKVNDMAKSFEELVMRTTTKETRRRAERRTKELLVGMLLSEIRKLVGRNQIELARALGVKQPVISRLESQNDMQVSTLKKIIEALGGEIHIIARFPKNAVRIEQFEKRKGKNGVRAEARELEELQLV